MAKQCAEVWSTAVSACKVNGSVVVVRAGEESERAFYDVYSQPLLHLNVIHYSLEIENIKSTIKIQASII